MSMSQDDFMTQLALLRGDPQGQQLLSPQQADATGNQTQMQQQAAQAQALRGGDKPPDVHHTTAGGAIFDGLAQILGNSNYLKKLLGKHGGAKPTPDADGNTSALGGTAGAGNLAGGADAAPFALA